MSGRRAARVAAEAVMRAPPRAWRRELWCARHLSVVAPVRPDYLPPTGDRVRSSRGASTSTPERSPLPPGSPTVGFAASSTVARTHVQRTAPSARGFAAVPHPTPPDAPPRKADRDEEDGGEATLAPDPGARPAPWSYGDIATIPNALSIARGVAGPLIAYGIVNDAPPELILGGVVAAGVSDWLDGYLARRWNQTGVAGSYLDPAGDKVFVASVAVALAAKGAIPAWLAACFLGRDAALIEGVSYQRARSLGWRWETWGEFFGLDAEVGDEPGGDDRLGTKGRARDGRTVSAIRSLPAMEPQAMGKWSTAVQFALFGCAAASQTAWGAAAVPPEAMAALHYVAGGTTAASAATYYFLSSDRFRARRERMEARVARGKERMAAVKELGRSLKERGRANVSEKMERVGEKMGRIREKMRNADHAGPGRTQVE